MIKNLPVQENAFTKDPKNPYTGKNGCYVSVSPVMISAEWINWACRDSGVPLDEGRFAKLHVTVMWSKVPAFNVDFIDPHARMTAVVDGLVWWPGHDNAGYLVMKLRSPEIDALHMQLINEGCQHLFSDYDQHVTIQEPCPWTDTLPDAIRKFNQCQGYTLVFENPLVEDVKK